MMFSPTREPFALPLFLAVVLATVGWFMAGPVFAIDQNPQLPAESGALMIDPVFLPTNLATTFHMTPILFRGGHVLRAGEFDFDFAMGTYGTDFDVTEKFIRIKENSDWSVYTDFGWRFGLLNEIGPLQIPVEAYTELPVYWGSTSFDSFFLQNGAYQPVDSLDEDFALGKWIWGLRFGLLQEQGALPGLVLGTSLGLPVDDSLASDSVDFDLRLTLEKHFARGLAGSLYGGMLFPGDGKEVLTRLGVDEDGQVPYVGLQTQANLNQLLGDAEPGPVWLNFGGSWRDSLYDFGALGPDYAEEELKLTGGLTFDLGWMGCRVGRPQAMVGLAHTLHGGPEEGETEFLVGLHLPYHFGRTAPCE